LYRETYAPHLLPIPAIPFFLKLYPLTNLKIEATSFKAQIASLYCNGWVANVIGTDARSLPECDLCALL
jgi:hypothetical protein